MRDTIYAAGASVCGSRLMCGSNAERRRTSWQATAPLLVSLPKPLWARHGYTVGGPFI
nr:MAG TPA: hypothetical protein [Caudoviricetes sp.]